MITKLGKNKWTTGLTWSTYETGKAKEKTKTKSYGVKYTSSGEDGAIVNTIGVLNSPSKAPSAAYFLHKYQKSQGITSPIMYAAQANENGDKFWMAIIGSEGSVLPNTDIVDGIDNIRRKANSLLSDFQNVIVIVDNKLTQSHFPDYQSTIKTFDDLVIGLPIKREGKIKKLSGVPNSVLYLIGAIGIIGISYYFGMSWYEQKKAEEEMRLAEEQRLAKLNHDIQKYKVDMKKWEENKQLIIQAKKDEIKSYLTIRANSVYLSSLDAIANTPVFATGWKLVDASCYSGDNSNKKETATTSSKDNFNLASVVFNEYTKLKDKEHKIITPICGIKFEREVFGTVLSLKEKYPNIVFNNANSAYLIVKGNPIKTLQIDSDGNLKEQDVTNENVVQEASGVYQASDVVLPQNNVVQSNQTATASGVVPDNINQNNKLTQDVQTTNNDLYKVVNNGNVLTEKVFREQIVSQFQALVAVHDIDVKILDDREITVTIPPKPVDPQLTGAALDEFKAKNLPEEVSIGYHTGNIMIGSNNLILSKRAFTNIYDNGISINSIKLVFDKYNVPKISVDSSYFYASDKENVTIEADKNVITEQKFEKGKDVQIEGNGVDNQNGNNMSRNNNSNGGNNLAEPLK